MVPKWLRFGVDVPSITVKNIPDDLYQRLKLRAAANHRSINSEIIVCIEQILHSQQVEGSEFPPDTYRLREMKKDYHTVEEANQAVVRSINADLRGESKEAFYRLVAEVVEDLLLAHAIQEGESSEDVSREEIDQILGGES
jgi:antitoxin FitA